ncbi:hypothetical protein [Emticicia sp. BO119]|uniref:hypothetical protein n=1 Tax=Emticicia sp. BO119 TaxID=2757768 RepID=UPI0015F0CE4D|nr:hypothetical protein [Emticicia sp. BO119]MBA4851156.1 hypothetical protein [Emticicia sp. BO119]
MHSSNATYLSFKSRKFLFIFFFLFLSIFFKVSGQSPTPKQIFRESLSFLIKTQCDSTITGKQYAGEWPVYMNLIETYIFIGKKRKARDSNCFNISAVHNFLSEIYLHDTTLHELKPVLAKAFNEIKTYEVDKRYNFWKLLPAVRNHRMFGKDPHLLVRRPTNYPLNSRFINKTANVPEDADDTALANTATYYHNRIFNDTLKALSYAGFDEYLDKKRKNRNWYNFMLPTPGQSGAYLTWHHQEYEYDHWNPVTTYFSLLFIFSPFSSAFPVAYEPWIPFGANDVDVVVNSNILNYLSLTSQVNKSAGKNGALKVIGHCVRKNLWSTGAVYYPNSYHIDFAVAKAFRNGVEELAETTKKIVKHLTETQQPNGSFESKPWVNKKDIIQSTAYALHAMIDLRAKGMAIPDQNIRKAFEFLLTKAQRKDGMCHWEGGVYFSGGTLLRNILIWQSDAYTTALIASCFQRYYL